jgi:transposase-like protein
MQATGIRAVAACHAELGLTPSASGNWVRQARADRSKGKTGLTTEERAELAMSMGSGAAGIAWRG